MPVERHWDCFHNIFGMLQPMWIQCEFHPKADSLLLMYRWMDHNCEQNFLSAFDRDRYETKIVFFLRQRWELYLQTHLRVQHCVGLASKNLTYSICIGIEEVDLGTWHVMSWSQRCDVANDRRHIVLPDWTCWDCSLCAVTSCSNNEPEMQYQVEFGSCFSRMNISW